MDIALKMKRAVAGLSAGFVALSSFVFANGTASADTFADVSPTLTPWSYNYIEQGVEDGYFDAGTNFRPHDNIQRDEVAKTLSVITKCETGFTAPATPTFKDVPKGWSYSHIECLAEKGIITGDTDPVTKLPTGFYRPADDVNRAEAVKLVVQALAVEMDLDPDSKFSDVANKAEWYYNYVVAAYNQSVVDGYKDAQGNLTGKFGPADPITREQWAKILVTGQNPTPRTDDGQQPGEDGICPDDQPNDPDCEPTLPPDNFKGDLEVSLDDTLTGGTLPLSATNVVLADFDFHAVGGDVNVKSLEVLREGVGKAQDFANVYIYQDGVRRSSGKTFNSNTNIANFTTLQDLVIKSGETSEVTVVAEVAGPGVAGSSDEHIISLAAADDVILNGDGEVTGDFAMKGPKFTIGGQTTVVNDVTVTKGSSLANIPLGSVHAEMATIKFEAGNENNLELEMVTLTQGGTVDSSDIANLTLEINGEELAKAEEIQNDRVTFILEEPLVIEEGKTKNVSVFGDVVGGKTSDTIRFYLDENTDVNAVDTQFNYGAKVINNFTLALSNLVKLEGGDLTVVKMGPASKQIASESDDNSLLEYSITSVNEGIEVRDTQVAVTIKDAANPANIPNFTANVNNGLNAVPVLGGGNCDADHYNLVTDDNINGSLSNADMLQLGSAFARVVESDADNDANSSNGGVCVFSSSDLTTLTNATALTEVNPYSYLEELTLVDVTDEETVLSSGKELVSQSELCTADNTPLAVCDVANTYAYVFTDDYELPVGTSKYSIRVDVASEMVAGYQVGAAVQFPENSMKNTESNEFVTPSEIVGAGNVALKGNFMSIVEDDIIINKAALPTSQTFVKGSQNVPMLGITFQPGDAGDMTLNDMKVRFYADASATNPWAVGHELGDTSAQNVILTASLYDGNTLVDGPVSLDLVDTGAAGYTTLADYFVADFSNLKFALKSGVSKTLTVKVNLNGNDFTGSLAADVIPSADIELEDKDGDTVTPTGGALNGALQKSPLITIGNAGSLTFTSQGNPDPGIAIAGTEDQIMARYDVKALNEDQEITRLSIKQDLNGAFDLADIAASDAIEQVVIKYPNEQGQIVEATAALNGQGVATFSLQQNPFYVKKDVVAKLEVFADVADKGTGPGEAISGRQIRLGLVDTGNTDTTFRAVGQGGNQVINQPVVNNNTNVPVQVVRMTKPTIAKAAGLSGNMDPGETTLYSFTVKADAAGSVNLARLVFDVQLNGATLDLDDFRFFRGAQVLNNVNIMGENAGDLLPAQAGALTNGADDSVIVSFNSLESISAGQTVTYSLKATPAQAAQDDTIVTKFAIGDENAPVTNIAAGSTCGVGNNVKCSTGNQNTGRIYDADANEALFTGNVDTVFADTLDTARNFIWGDNSADDGGYPEVMGGAVTAGTGSYDWTNGYLLKIANVSSHVVKQQ